MGAGNPRKAVKLAGKGIRPGDAVSKRKFAKQEEYSLVTALCRILECLAVLPMAHLSSNNSKLGCVRWANFVIQAVGSDG
jgi:hypothetical protein